MDKKKVKNEINKQENKDFRLYRKFIDTVRPGRYTLGQTRYGTEYDAIQTDVESGERIFIEVKQREKYRYDDFRTFLLSLHKLDSMQLMMKKENAQRGFVVGIYPDDSKIVLFDITNLPSTLADITWRKVKKTEYDPDSEMVYQPFAELNLKHGKYKHYSTYVYNFGLKNLDF